MAFLGKKGKKLTRLFFATDIHGSERTYRKFINAGKFYEANVIVMGGDISGKLMIPIIQEGNGRHRATLQGSVQKLETEEELKKLQDRVGLLGFYSQVMSEDEYRDLSAKPDEVSVLFHKLAKERLATWVELAENRLKGTGIKCFVTGGNDDDPEVLEAIHNAGGESFFACEGQVVQVDEQHTMASVGFSNPTPWKTPREIPDEKLGEIIEGMCAQVKDFSHCIFNFHVPPLDSTLDSCPKLDWTTDPPTPIMSGGQMVFAGAGSRAVRDSIEKHQPMLGLHGHIHEAQGLMKIGRTTCINPGSEYGEGILRGCLVTFADGKIEGSQMTSG
jgi:uncharacterized protein